MKTAKMALKIILALSLPLNVMASGNSQSASGRELSIQTKLDIQELKMERNLLQKQIARSMVALKVLEDIADPSLLGFYRQNDVEVALMTAFGGGISTYTILFAGLHKLAPDSILEPAFKGAAVVAISGAVVTMGEILSQMIQGDEYQDFYIVFRHLSSEAQKEAFLGHKNRTVAAAVKAEQLTEQIEALEQ